MVLGSHKPPDWYLTLESYQTAHRVAKSVDGFVFAQ
jgi:hypothetical protein